MTHLPPIFARALIVAAIASSIAASHAAFASATPVGTAVPEIKPISRTAIERAVLPSRTVAIRRLQEGRLAEAKAEQRSRAGVALTTHPASRGRLSWTRIV